MKKKLIVGLLAFTMMASAAMPTMAAAKAEKISIKGKKTVTVGKTIELDSVVTPKEAEVKDSNIIWSSSKPSVAKILEKRDDDTKIKGMKAGTATITVRIKGTSIKKNYKITVKKASKNSKTSTDAAIKKINTYKTEAKNLKTEISNIQPAETIDQRREQYRAYEAKIDAIDRKLDKLDDKWEDKYKAGKITRSMYRSLERKIDAVEDYLDELEDYLDQKFIYEFD